MAMMAPALSGLVYKTWHVTRDGHDCKQEDKKRAKRQWFLSLKRSSSPCVTLENLLSMSFPRVPYTPLRAPLTQRIGADRRFNGVEGRHELGMYILPSCLSAV